MKPREFNLNSKRLSTATKKDFITRAGFTNVIFTFAEIGKCFGNEHKKFLAKVDFDFIGEHYTYGLFKSDGVVQRQNAEYADLPAKLMEEHDKPESDFKIAREYLGWDKVDGISMAAGQWSARKNIGEPWKEALCKGTWHSDLMKDENAQWDEFYLSASRLYARQVLASDTLCKCSKCGGTGFLPHFAHVDEGRCWDCCATGVAFTSLKVVL